MSTLRPYIRVIRQQIANSLAKLMAFRVSFLFLILVEVASLITAYVPASFLFNHVERLGPWNRSEFMFFIFWIQGMFCCHNGLVAPNFWNFAAEIRTGALDFRLLRPLGSVFDVMTAISRPATLMMLPFSAACLVYFGLQIRLSVLAWLTMPFVFGLAFLTMVVIELNLACLAFWTKGGDGANFVRMQCQQIQRWPDFMYPKRSRLFFSTAFPVLASGSFSVQFLFDTSRWDRIVLMGFVTLLFWLLASYLWSRGVRQYESASS